MKNSIYLFLYIIGIFILGILASSCKKDNLPSADNLPTSSHAFSGDNIQPFDNGIMPKATVKLKKFDNPSSRNLREFSSSLSPANIEALLAPGASISVDDIATITLPIERGDVMFMFDLTKSMLQELANVKVNSQNIMGAIGSVINDVNFGVVSHMDYTGSYDNCGYDDRYGGAQYGDYPYQLNQTIVLDTSLVAQAINSLQIGWGWDYPEDYTRVLYELSAPGAEIGWRQNSKRIVVAWLDNQPHDCSLGTGPDPGRDEIEGTEDDLDINNVLAGLVDNKIVLIVLYSGGDPGGGEHLELWENYCAITGGAAYRINQDGTIPDNVDIDEYIKNIISTEITHVDHLTLEACDESYAGWISNVSPAEYTNISESGTFPFTLEITVPQGTQNGVYEFDVCLLGDGFEFGKQHVKIRVFDGLAVPFDIKPAGCPNPFNVHDSGVLPVAILGFSGLNVRDIDISSINIGGVYPSKDSFDKVGKPYFPLLDKPLDQMSCNKENDGIEDLNLKFDNLQLAGLLSGYHNGDIVRIYIEGKLKNGTNILGEDIVRIIKNSDTQKILMK